MPTVLPANPVLLRNPVAGVIHPISWSRPAGNYDFKVTQVEGCTGVPQEPPLGTCAHFHRAIDIANRRCGDPVYAPRAGTVWWSGRMSDGANVVVIDHGGGYASAACHLSSRLVATGAKVAKGQKIGYIGSTGNSTGCHDHFPFKSGTVRSKSFWSDSNGKWLDPWRYLEQNIRVRPQPSTPGINIRTGAGTPGTGTLAPVYAHVDPDGHIRRNSDNKDLGLASTWFDWGAEVLGANYTVNGVSGKVWDQIWLDGRWLYIARLLDQLAS